MSNGSSSKPKETRKLSGLTGQPQKSLAADLVVGALGSRSAAEALDAGVLPRAVWDALCDAMEVSDAVRWHFRDAPAGRRRRTV
jgi:hypothetical protein